MSCPKTRLGIISFSCGNNRNNVNMDRFIGETVDTQKQMLRDMKETHLPIIEETRSAYKACGKEPSRYRPSAEALLRRVRTGKSLYRVNNIVDTINILSMSTHFSIGGFDETNISGEITLDIGGDGPYDAIGRGNLNIEFMPGLRDEHGFFGTPTSDSTRTMVTENTSEVLLVFYDFGRSETLENSLDLASQLFSQYCDGRENWRTIVD